MYRPTVEHRTVVDRTRLGSPTGTGPGERTLADPGTADSSLPSGHEAHHRGGELSREQLRHRHSSSIDHVHRRVEDAS